MSVAAKLFLLSVALHLSGALSECAVLRHFRLRNSGNSTLALRKRLHVDPLIADPGTGEIDWSGLYSFSSGSYSFPSAVKYTPEGTSIPWGRTEYSLAFDTLDVSQTSGSRLTQFSETVTFTATSVVHDGEHLSLAFAPQVTCFLRDESGIRAGAVAIARYDRGYNSVGMTAGWSGATHNSDNNPAGTFDLGLGLGHQLHGSKFLEKLTPHFNSVLEKSTGVTRSVSVFEGVEYQWTERVAFDVSGQHYAIAGGSQDNQIVVGISVALGRLR